eukprot:maker-scaffold1_size3401120-snap-gene-26.42 protein:Tk04933 transcript:maker-scaffold1_size3401120-snap-gene-26.42-mRNA-1 annotation:"atp-dependent dna helicase"
MTTPLSPQKVLEETFGYQSFRGLQGEVVQHICDGGSALVLMPTGGGKSLCYQVPALVREGLTIVVSPLIALMQDQVQNLQQNGVAAAFLNSSLSQQAAQAVLEDVRQGGLRLLYMAPERLLMPATLNLLHTLKIALFAIDEAHCVSQWGHDFRPEYAQLSQLAEQFPDVPRLALTATADDQTRADIKARLQLFDHPEYIDSFDRPNIQYHIQTRHKGIEQLLNFINENHADRPDVRFVAHFDLPKSIEAYYQETGRAGRDGLPSTVWMGYGLQDAITLRQMMENGSNNDQRRVEHHKLEAMLGL